MFVLGCNLNTAFVCTYVQFVTVILLKLCHKLIKIKKIYRLERAVLTAYQYICSDGLSGLTLAVNKRVRVLIVVIVNVFIIEKQSCLLNYGVFIHIHIR